MIDTSKDIPLRLLILVIDTSASMLEPIMGDTSNLDKINFELQDFYREIKNEEFLRKTLEVSLITFNDDVTTMQEPALVEDFVMPTLETEGSTAMVDAVYEAIGKVLTRKEWYKHQGLDYMLPHIILITDGKYNSNQQINALSDRIKFDTEAKQYAFIPIGVEGADMSVLYKITDGDLAISLGGETLFGVLEEWIGYPESATIRNVTNAEITDSDDIEWMLSFTV